MSSSKKFTPEQSEYIKKELEKLEELTQMFFQEHLLKPYETWVEEAMVNGVNKTMERFEAFVKEIKG